MIHKSKLVYHFTIQLISKQHIQVMCIYKQKVLLYGSFFLIHPNDYKKIKPPQVAKTN